MALVKMSILLNRAKQRGIGCGSFSVYSMEAVMGAVKAAEELNTPVILQLAEARFRTAPLELVGPMMIHAARRASVDIAVHLDHAASLESVQSALELGFSSVMYDGSALPFADNVSRTKEAKAVAAQYGADLEAELGMVGKSEGGEIDFGIQCTVPRDAEDFVKKTEIEALAVAIGNQHGNYTAAPNLRFDILKEIHRRVPENHLVLHGGSGISDADFQRCIRNGITKINIATAILNQMTENAAVYVRSHPNGNYYGLSDMLAAGAYEVVKHHIQVFNMERSCS